MTPSSPAWRPWHRRARFCTIPPYPEQAGGAPRSARLLLSAAHPATASAHRPVKQPPTV